MFNVDNPHNSVIVATPAVEGPVPEDLFYEALDSVCDAAVGENKDTLVAIGATPFDSWAFHAFILLPDTWAELLALLGEEISEEAVLEENGVIKRTYSDEPGGEKIGAVYLIPLATSVEWAEFSNYASHETVVNGGLITAFPTGIVLGEYDPRERSQAQKLDLLQVAAGLLDPHDMLNDEALDAADELLDHIARDFTEAVEAE